MKKNMPVVTEIIFYSKFHSVQLPGTTPERGFTIWRSLFVYR